MTTVSPLIYIYLNGPSQFVVADWWKSTANPAGRSLNISKDSKSSLPFASNQKRFFFGLVISQLFSLLYQSDVPSLIMLLPLSFALALERHRGHEVLDTSPRGQQCGKWRPAQYPRTLGHWSSFLYQPESSRRPVIRVGDISPLYQLLLGASIGASSSLTSYTSKYYFICFEVYVVLWSTMRKSGEHEYTKDHVCSIFVQISFVVWFRRNLAAQKSVASSTRCITERLVMNMLSN